MESKINQEELRKRFPELIYSESMNEINGKIHIECKCRDEYINDSFEIKIKLIDSGIPEVFDICKRIKMSYGHIYNNSKLCLATDLEQELYLRNHSIYEWIDEYVIKYFISYIFYQKYKVFPFEDHSHGEKGILEFLREFWNVENDYIAKKILEYICTKPYRGHNSCPCGSGKRLRNCHGKLVLDIINSENLKIYKENYRRIKDVGKI